MSNLSSVAITAYIFVNCECTVRLKFRNVAKSWATINTNIPLVHSKFWGRVPLSPVTCGHGLRQRAGTNRFVLWTCAYFKTSNHCALHTMLIQGTVTTRWSLFIHSFIHSFIIYYQTGATRFKSFKVNLSTVHVLSIFSDSARINCRMCAELDHTRQHKR